MILAELNQFLKLTSPEATREIFGGKSNEKILEKLNSTETHWTRVIDWLEAKTADHIPKESKGVTPRLQMSKIQDPYRPSKSMAMKRYRLELKYMRQPLPLGSGVRLSSQYISRVWTLRKVK
jgi:hypothetical protein